MKIQKAWFYEEYKEFLKLGNLPISTLQHNHVLVQAYAATLNLIEFKRYQCPIFLLRFPVSMKHNSL